MISLRTSEIFEILSDFLTPPVYEGRGRWIDIVGVLKDIRQKELSGILFLQSSSLKIFNFFDYGRPLSSVSFENETLVAYEGDEFFREREGTKHIRPYRYQFSPLSSDVVMVVSAFHESSLTLDSITPFPDKTLENFESLEFSGILRSYSPVVFSAVFLEGILVGTFFQGSTFNIKDLLRAEDELYEFKAFNVKDRLYERSYTHLFNKLRDKTLDLYVRLSNIIEDLHVKVRREMLKRSQAEPLLDPLIGLVEVGEGTLSFHIPHGKGLYALQSFFDVLESVIRLERDLSPAIVRKTVDEIHSLKNALREGL